MRPEKDYDALPGGRRQGRGEGWSLRRKLVLGGVVLAIILALVIGLSVGLTVGRGSSDDEDSTPTTPIPGPGNESVPATLWKPEKGTTWTYQLLDTPDDTTLEDTKVDVWDIDMFNSNASLIKKIQESGSKVICYFSAGSYEDWRPDKEDFKDDDLGKELDGWPGERWLDLNSANVRSIMETRLDMAKEKGCDGVDPDNVDGYDNENGLGLTEDDSTNFMRFLADASFSRNMSIGLKNAAAIIPNVIDIMQWSVNEQCVQFEECDKYAAFVQEDKPVFHVEYPKGDETNNDVKVSSSQYSTACDNNEAQGFSTIIKNMDLDSFIQLCPNTS